MFKAFRDRRPWAAASVNLILSPVFGMLYLNRGLYAVYYWVASLFSAILCFSLFPGFFSASKGSEVVYLANLPLHIAGAFHAFFITRKQPWEPRLKWYAHWYSALGIAFVLPAILAFGIRTFLYRPFSSPSAAMMPTVNVGDSFLVARFSYNFASPRHGDVVAFYMQEPKTYFIKRVVGLPGDRVQMVHGRLLLNGERLPIRHMKRVAEPCEFDPPCQTVRYEEVYPGGKAVWILDQVADGQLDNTEVFHVPADAYFVLGDNRDNSFDSRTGIGFVPRSSIAGRVAYKYISGGHWTWQPVN
jgi:signal peptidase I